MSKAPKAKLLRTELIKIATTIGEEGGEGFAYRVGEQLARSGMGPDVVRAAFDELARSQESATMDGYLALLRWVAEILTEDAKSGARPAKRMATEFLEAVDTETLARRALAADALLPVARSLMVAGMDPPPALRAAVCERHDREEAGDFAERLRDVAAAFGDDAVGLHDQIAQLLALAPDERRPMAIIGIIRNGQDDVRAAMTGFLLSPDMDAAHAAAAALREDPKRPLRPSALARLEMMRAWVAPTLREAIDAILAAAKYRSKKAAAVADLQFFASPMDGSGGQSLFWTGKGKRGRMLGSALIKDGKGLTDAWVARDLPKPQTDAMATSIQAEGFAAPVSRALFVRRLADALGANTPEAPPPFGLTDFLPPLGLGELGPAIVAPAALIDDLLRGAPEPPPAEDVDWDACAPVMKTWIEAGPDVAALLGPLRSKKKRQAAIAALLEERRQDWARRCAWTAAVLKETGDTAWLPLAAAGRDIAGAASVESVPLMAKIAADTLTAFAAATAPRQGAAG